MTTTDSRGIVFLQETDPIAPFHTLINGLQTGTSTALGGVEDRLDDTTNQFYEGTRSTSLSVPAASTGDGTAVTWLTQNSSVLTMAGSVLTIQQAGRYLISLAVAWDGRAGGDRLVRVKVNGSFMFLANENPTTSTTTATTICVEKTFGADTTLEVFARQNSSGTLTVVPPYTHLSVSRRS